MSLPLKVGAVGLVLALLVWLRRRSRNLPLGEVSNETRARLVGSDTA